MKSNMVLQKRRLFELAEQTDDWTRNGLLKNVVHDHQTKLIAAKELPQPLNIVVTYPTHEKAPKEYILAIAFKRNIDTEKLFSYLRGKSQYRGYDIQPVTSALNAILAAHPAVPRETVP